MTILTVSDLTKKFGNFTAVDHLSFSLAEGEILGLLGPNGAGKTTTIQMLLGVLTPTSGNILYFGRDLAKHREEILEHISFSSTYTNLPLDLTVKENLVFLSYLYRLDNRKQRIREVVSMLDLEELLSTQVYELSAGQTTRVNLAKAFLNQPKVLLLDEPTASLDPDVAYGIRELLAQQRSKRQVSMIITSHNMNEVEQLCDRVIFIEQGKIVANDTPHNLARKISIARIRLLSGRRDTERISSYCLSQGIEHERQGSYVILYALEKNVQKILNDLSQQQIVYEEIGIEQPGLEDYFLHIARKAP